MSELNNQDHRVSETDLPWAKGLRNRGDVLPLARGVQAVVPRPHGEGYIYLSHDQYIEALGDLGRLTYDPNEIAPERSTGVSQEEHEAWAVASGRPLYEIGFVGIREQVRLASGIEPRPDTRDSDAEHPEPKEGEQ